MLALAAICNNYCYHGAGPPWLGTAQSQVKICASETIGYSLEPWNGK